METWKLRRALAAGLWLAALAPTASADAFDWPQFRGPNRDGISQEKILTSWPEKGPRELWRVPIGSGFSAITVAGDRLYTMDSKGEDEFAVAFDAASGKEAWRTRVGPIFREYWGDGPRSAPTLDGDLVYVLGAQGNLAALKAADGSRVWEVDFKERFKSATPEWGFTMTPIVVGDLLVIETGGQGEASIAGLDKKTGATRWTANQDPAGYSSPIAVRSGGTDLLVFLTAVHVVGITPQGKVLWKVPFEPREDIKPAMPVFVAPDLIFVSASYDVGALVLRLKGTGVEEVWRSRVMRNHFNASVALGPHLYGFDNSAFKCIEAATGAQKWIQRGGLGKGSLIFADGHFLVLTELGRLLLVEASPEGYKEKAGVQVLQGRTWTSPTLANGRLYLRNREEMVALDVSAGAAAQKGVAP